MNSNRGKKNSIGSESESTDDIWDDTLIIRNYDESLAIVKEVVAKKLAMKTNKKLGQGKPVKGEEGEAGTSSGGTMPAEAASSSQLEPKLERDEEESSGVEGSTGAGEKEAGEMGAKPVYKVGDYCRATYEDDGVDYEAKIMAIGKNQDALIRFIGYNNEQTVTVDDLVPSWGRKARRKQREDAAEEAAEADSHRMEISDDEEKLTKKASKIRINYGPNFAAAAAAHQAQPPFAAHAAFGAGMGASFMVPPPPPMPPMLEHEDDLESENLSAMLMSWYMSGYYTGLYHGQKMSQKRARPS